jgi:hypothetical protein
MKPLAPHTEYHPELEGLDPVAMLVIPLAILLLSLIVIRAIVAAVVV